MHFNPNLINVNPTAAHSNASTTGQYHSRHEAKTSEVLNENVKRGVGQATGTSSAGLQLGDKKDAQDVAKTMLDHVQKGLDQLRAQGADEDRIQQRLEAAKEGIAKGYEQAEQQLKDMGLLNDELKAEIDQGRGLIDAGLEQMSGNVEAKDTKNKVGTLMPKSSSNSRYSSQASIENSMSLELMTKDGDKISLSFMQSAQSFSYAAQEGHQMITAAGFEQGMAWQMDVMGSLDEGEQEALANLLQDVEKLSSTFFSGDLGGALEQAMGLGFDGNELASMSLNLRQESFSSVSRAYNSVQPQLPTPQLEGLSSPLLAYNDDYLSALEQAKSFADPEKLIDDLVDQLFPDDNLKNIFQAYNQGLRSAMDDRASLMGELLG
jgi:flagellar biosynthesis/type III secretory pathway protein FliH